MATHLVLLLVLAVLLMLCVAPLLVLRLYRPNQTRPDPTRADQSRAQQSRADPTRVTAAPWPQQLHSRRQTRRCAHCRIRPGRGALLMLMMRQRMPVARHQQHPLGQACTALGKASAMAMARPTSQPFRWLLLTQQISMLCTVGYD